MNQKEVLSGVSRDGNRVTLQLHDFSVGPGNYELKEIIMPYEMIMVEKEGSSWGTDIEFFVDSGAESSSGGSCLKHFIS